MVPVLMSLILIRFKTLQHFTVTKISLPALGAEWDVHFVVGRDRHKHRIDFRIR